MKSLKRDYRVVIYLHYYEGYSVKELSKILKISESNVKVRLSVIVLDDERIEF